MDQTKVIIIGMDYKDLPPSILERGHGIDAIFIDEARDLLSIRDQIARHLGRDISIGEIGEMIGRLNEPTAPSLSRTLEVQSLDLTPIERPDLNDYDPPKNYLFNTPPRQKKDRNRPDKITLARRKKRKR